MKKSLVSHTIAPFFFPEEMKNSSLNSMTASTNSGTNASMNSSVNPTNANMNSLGVSTYASTNVNTNASMNFLGLPPTNDIPFDSSTTYHHQISYDSPDVPFDQNTTHYDSTTTDSRIIDSLLERKDYKINTLELFKNEMYANLFKDANPDNSSLEVDSILNSSNQQSIVNRDTDYSAKDDKKYESKGEETEDLKLQIKMLLQENYSQDLQIQFLEKKYSESQVELSCLAEENEVLKKKLSCHDNNFESHHDSNQSDKHENGIYEENQVFRNNEASKSKETLNEFNDRLRDSGVNVHSTSRINIIPERPYDADIDRGTYAEESSADSHRLGLDLTLESVDDLRIQSNSSSYRNSHASKATYRNSRPTSYRNSYPSSYRNSYPSSYPTYGQNSIPLHPASGPNSLPSHSTSGRNSNTSQNPSPIQPYLKVAHDNIKPQDHVLDQDYNTLLAQNKDLFSYLVKRDQEIKDLKQALRTEVQNVEDLKKVLDDLSKSWVPSLTFWK